MPAHTNRQTVGFILYIDIESGSLKNFSFLSSTIDWAGLFVMGQFGLVKLLITCNELSSLFPKVIYNLKNEIPLYKERTEES